MRKRITTIIFMTALSWAFQVDAGPIGDRPRIWPEFQYRYGAADSPFSGALDGVDDETIALDLLFGEIEYAPEVGGDSASSSNEEGRPKIPVNAFIFSYGEYRHQWEVPRHQAPRAPIIVQEPTFQYRGPPPEPEPPAVDQEEDPYKYRYPEELIKPVHRHPTGLVDTFELEYSLQLEADAAHYMYPFAPKDIPEPEQRVFRYGKVSPGTGAGGLQVTARPSGNLVMSPDTLIEAKAKRERPKAEGESIISGRKPPLSPRGRLTV